MMTCEVSITNKYFTMYIDDELVVEEKKNDRTTSAPEEYYTFINLYWISMYIGSRFNYDEQHLLLC